MRRAVLGLTVAVGAFASGAVAGERTLLIDPQLEKATPQQALTVAGRTVLRYRHAPDPAWAAETPKDFLSGLENKKRRDHFTLVLPQDATPTNPPTGRALVVLLHGRNGGRFMNASDSCIGGVGDPDSPFYTPPDAYALGVDALANLLSDEWYGAMPPPKTIYDDSVGNLFAAGGKDGANEAKELGMTVLPAPWAQSDYTHWGPNRYAGYLWENAVYGELFEGPRREPFRFYRSAPQMTCLKWNLCHENAVVKRILDEIEWTVRTYGIDRNRIYAVGNSMGGQAALTFALTHGEIFAAVNADVPATIWYPVARAGFVDERGDDVAAAAFVQPAADPAPIFDWSGSDDAWSRAHDVLYRNCDRFRLAITGWWGAFGHCGSLAAARRKNDLVFRGVDFFSLRRDRAYVVFSKADCNDVLPWPETSCATGAEGEAPKVVNGIELKAGRLVRRTGSPEAGQWNGWLRGEVVVDEPDRLEADVWLATAAEIPSTQLTRPTAATADVSFRRLQKFPHAKGARASWTMGGQSGELSLDACGLFTLERVPLSATEKTRIVLRPRS